MMSVIDKLVGLVEHLYIESADYIDNPSDAQIWYNRGYANGVVAYLQAQGFAEKLANLTLDAPGLHDNERVMEWQKAYHHGFEMGERESAEVNQTS